MENWVRRTPATYGRISSANDVDIYWIDGTYANTIDFDIDSRVGDGSGLDFYIRLFNSRGKELAANDSGLAPGDVQLGTDPYLRYSFDDGDFYYLGISTASNKNYDPLKPYKGPNNPTGSLGIYEISTRRHYNMLDPVDRKKATRLRRPRCTTVLGSGATILSTPILLKHMRGRP